MKANRLITAFFMVWFGQTISLIGTSMSRFALMIWVWQQTNEAMPTILTGVSGAVSSLLLSLVAGAIVDRVDRKRVMIFSDLAAGLSTLTIFVLFSSQTLEIWHLYVTAAIAGGAGTFQHLAYSASITVMLPKSQYTRASAMNSLSEYGSKIGAPLIAGLLIGLVGVSGILLIDIASFLFAIGTLLLIHIPPATAISKDREDSNTNTFLQDMLFGFRYILRRSNLLGLLMIAFAFSTAEALGYPLITPMILARTDGNEVVLGSVQAVLGIGGLTGAALLVLWGGPRRRIHGVLLGVILTGLLGDALMGLGQSFPVWLTAAVFLEILIPITLGCYHAIWQSKIPAELQGRVFAARNFISTVAEPISMLVTGMLSDHVLEPALIAGGMLAPSLGILVGTGPGAGMGLLLVIAGLLSALAGLSGYAFPAIRLIEEELPD